MRALFRTDPRQAVKVAGPLHATELWRAPIGGATEHRVVTRPDLGSVYVSDGWGVSYAGLRFTRLDILTGESLAFIRTGTAIRCFADVGDTNLLAASDSKLFRVDARTLAERARWDRRVPRVADTMVVNDGAVALANWLRPGITIVDLATGRVRRRRTARMVTLHALDGDALVVGGETGGVDRLELRSGAIQHVIDAPPAMSADIAPGGNELLIVVGRRAYATGTSVGPGSPSLELRRLRLDGTQEPTRLLLPKAVRIVKAGTATAWLTPGPMRGTEQFVLAVEGLDAAAPQVRIWQAPRDVEIVDVSPSARLALTVRSNFQSSSAVLTCYRLDD